MANAPFRDEHHDLMSALVSCVIPVFNGAEHLESSLRSVLEQSYPSVEIIAVDDGSTDETPDVLNRFSDRITLVHQANAGPPVARNTGVALAKGEYVAFNDADDLWVPDKLERQLAVLTSEPHLGYCVGHAQNFWEEEVAEEAARFKDHPRSKPIAAYVTQAMLVRRTVLDTVGPFDPSLGHGDSADWFLRARRLGIEGRLIPDVVLLRRLHHANRSRVSAEDSRQEFLAILKRSLDRRRRMGWEGSE